MTELAIPEARSVAIPAAQLPVPAMDDIDSWTKIVVQVVRLAEEICDTPFVPDGLRGSAPAVSAAILSGREMGLGPMTSLANIDVIRGKPTQKPLLMRAMILARGHKWVDVDVSDIRVVVKGCRKGESEWTEVIFTADQAKRAGIDLGKYPADKLYARASSRLARRKFADVIMGMAYSADEAEDDDSPEVDTATGEVKAIEPARAPRTAQRRQRTQSPPPAPDGPSTPAVASQTVPEVASAGGGLPPLPGEEDAPGPETGNVPATQQRPAGSDAGTGPGAPEPITTKQLTAIWTVLSDVFLFGKDERDEARKVCAHILNHDLASSKDMSKQEAMTVLDTLAHWEAQAEREGESPRAYLQVMTKATEDETDGE